MIFACLLLHFFPSFEQDKIKSEKSHTPSLQPFLPELTTVNSVYTLYVKNFVRAYCIGFGRLIKVTEVYFLLLGQYRVKENGGRTALPYTVMQGSRPLTQRPLDLQFLFTSTREDISIPNRCAQLHIGFLPLGAPHHRPPASWQHHYPPVRSATIA